MKESDTPIWEQLNWPKYEGGLTAADQVIAYLRKVQATPQHIELLFKLLGLKFEAVPYADENLIEELPGYLARAGKLPAFTVALGAEKPQDYRKVLGSKIAPGQHPYK